MIKQFWKITIQDEIFEVGYICSPMIGKTTLTVDGDSFTIKHKPFCIGIQRRELIMLGMSQGILDVSKKGKATIIVKGADVEEVPNL